MTNSACKPISFTCVGLFIFDSDVKVRPKGADNLSFLPQGEILTQINRKFLIAILGNQYSYEI